MVRSTILMHTSLFASASLCTQHIKNLIDAHSAHLNIPFTGSQDTASGVIVEAEVQTAVPATPPCTGPAFLLAGPADRPIYVVPSLMTSAICCSALALGGKQLKGKDIPGSHGAWRFGTSLH